MITLLRWLFPIKNVSSDADSSPGCAPSFLYLTAPASGDMKLSVSSSFKSKSPSPKMAGSAKRQAPSVDSYLDSPSNLVPPSSDVMESSWPKEITDGKPTIKEILLKQSRGGSGFKSVVVIVDATTKELPLNALYWALSNVVEPKDAITLLGILHQVQNPMGYKQKADVSTFNGTNRKQLGEEISRKLEMFRTACLDPEIHRVCEQNGIKLEVKIAAGPSTKIVAVQWAVDLQASWVILDRAMKKDKKYLMEHLDCNLVLMKRNGGEVIRLNQPILDDAYVSDSILERLTPTDPLFLDDGDVIPMKSEGSEQSTQYPPGGNHQHSPTPSDEMEHQSVMVSDLRSSSSSSVMVDQHGRSAATTWDDNSGSEMVDQQNSTLFEMMSYEYEATGETALGTSRGSNRLDNDRSFSRQSTLSRSDSSLFDLSGPMSSSPSSDYEWAEQSRQTSSPNKNKISKTNPAAGLQGQMLHFSSADKNKGAAEISPRRAVETTSYKDWSPKSQSNVQQPTDAPRLHQSVYSVSPVSSQFLPITFPESPQGSGFNALSTSPSSEGLPVYHPKPVSARHNLELSHLLGESGSFGDRSTVRVSSRDVDMTAVSESRQTTVTRTPPIDIVTPRSRTPIEGVMTDAPKTGTLPSVAFLHSAGREIDRLKKYSLDAEEDDSYFGFNTIANPSMIRHMSFPLKRYTPGAPPLCSICNHKSPEFGRPPRKFTYAELEIATNNFSPDNFLAEGGFGFVYKGVLKEGQAVAVKQHKLASSQGDMEFCSEVEVLSCAQHRNLVTLIGYCVENNRRLLVYEFVCNGSLDWHLSARNSNVLEWQARYKIAVGAARGLRYLHEECRVGCIVHRDMRPNNILLTHDFTPMVGDFGLARWQPSGDTAVETRVIGTLGYLAPEYAETGQITEKADVYSFGVVLLELITGRKAIDAARTKGEQCLTEWARPKLEERRTHELVDPRLDAAFDIYELYCMVYAASLCIRREPSMRPKMSQVLRVLEGDNFDPTGSSPPPLGTFSRTPSTEAFTPTSYSTSTFSTLRRNDSSDSLFPIHGRAGSEVPGAGVKPEREPLLPQSAPLSRPGKSPADEKYPGEKSPHAGGSKSSHGSSTSGKTGSSPRSKLSYSYML